MNEYPKRHDAEQVALWIIEDGRTDVTREWIRSCSDADLFEFLEVGWGYEWSTDGGGWA